MKRPTTFAATCLAGLAYTLLPVAGATAFQGCIQATATQGSSALPLLYSLDGNSLRIEVADTNQPAPVDFVDLTTGELTLAYPRNGSFVRCPAVAATDAAPQPPGQPPAAPGAAAATGVPGMPSPGGGMGMGMAGMMAMMGHREKLELAATGLTTNLLGLDCAQYAVKQRGESLTIWATAQLFPFQAYRQNQPHRFGPRDLQEAWPALLAAKHLFPLSASLRYGDGPEMFRFEVVSITPQVWNATNTPALAPPANYVEIPALPF